MNRLVQAGALAALDDVDFVRRTLQVNSEGREQYYRAFETMWLTYSPRRPTLSSFVDLGRPAAPVFQAMLRDGVIVRPLTSMGETNGMRITIGTREQNERTIAALCKALAI